MMFHLYGLIVGIAVVVGWSVAERIEPKVSKVMPLVLLFGILGARLYHVVDLWEYYSQNLGQVPAIWRGGLGILGGLVGGFFGYTVYSIRYKVYKIDWNVLGAIATGLPLSQAIGRWGNLVNNELWGRGGQPLFLYESLLNLTLFGVMWFASLRGFSSKYRVGIYLMGYGVIRLTLEGLRVEAWVMDYYVSALMLTFGVVLWLDQRRRV